MNAIIIHGMPGKEEYLKDGTAAKNWWFPWLAQELQKRGIAAENPEMPEPYAPDYKKWCQIFEQFPLTKDTLLIGHSCGGGFLVRWLSEHAVEVGRVILVAPWIDPNHEWAPDMFNGLRIDSELAQRTRGIDLLFSNDDEQEELDSARILQEHIRGITVHQFDSRGHFLSKEIPEVMALVVEK